jgi:hypothetical protein
LRRNGISVDRHQRVGSLAAPHFFGNPVAELIDRIGDKSLQLIPVGDLGVPFEFLARSAGSIADTGGLGPQFRVVK